MPEKKIGPDENIAIIEQYDATLSNMAPLVGTYYKGLVDNGIPTELASLLVRDWHQIFWDTIANWGKK